MEDFWSSFSSFVHNMVPVSLSLQYFVSVAYAKLSIVVGLLCLVMSLPIECLGPCGWLCEF